MQEPNSQTKKLQNLEADMETKTPTYCTKCRERLVWNFDGGYNPYTGEKRISPRCPTGKKGHYGCYGLIEDTEGRQDPVWFSILGWFVAVFILILWGISKH